MYRLGLRLGLGSGNGFYMFLLFFFSTLKSDEHYAAMPLALTRDPGPTPSVGHVTGDMKRRESNETHGYMTARLQCVCDKLVSIHSSRARWGRVTPDHSLPFLTPPTRKGLGTKLVAAERSSCSRTDHSAVAWIGIMLT